MTYQCFELTIENQIAHIQLNRPDKHNSMVREFWTELPQVVRDIDNHARARVIVISARGKYFSSGIDIGMLAEAAASSSASSSSPDKQRAVRLTHGASFYGNVSQMQDTFSALEQCRLPVIAAVQGGCIGGGVDLVTACCMRYATEDAFFSIYETNIGMTADVGTFPRITRLIPEGLVRELAYTGRRYLASEALTTGFVNGVYPNAKALMDAVMEVAAEIATKAPLSVYGCKRIITYSRDHATDDTLDYVRLWNASFLQQEEVAEAFTARTEKRQAQFVDLPPILGVSSEIDKN